MGQKTFLRCSYHNLRELSYRAPRVYRLEFGTLPWVFGQIHFYLNVFAQDMIGVQSMLISTVRQVHHIIKCGFGPSILWAWCWPRGLSKSPLDLGLEDSFVWHHWAQILRTPFFFFFFDLEEPFFLSKYITKWNIEFKTITIKFFKHDCKG